VSIFDVRPLQVPGFMNNDLPQGSFNPFPATLMNVPGMTPKPAPAANDVYGLLGVDRNNARTMGLLAAASAFLDAGAGGRNPQDASLGRAAGRAALGGMGAYQNALKAGLAEKVAGLQAQKMISDQAAATRDTQLAQKLGIPTSALPTYYKAAIEQQFPKQQFMTITEKNAAQYGFTPEEVKEARKSGRALQINRSGEVKSVAMRQVPLVNMGGESTFDKQFAGTQAKDFAKIEEAANQADATKQTAQIGFQLLPKEMGPGRELKNQIDNLIQTGQNLFGIEVDPARTARITDFASYRTFLTDNLLVKLASQKGPQTEPDAQRAKQALLSAENPLQANRIIRDYQIALADRAVEYRDFLAKQVYAAEPKDRSKAFSQAKRDWSAFINRTPLVARIEQNGKTNVVFINKYIEKMAAANPNLSRNGILDQWRILVKAQGRK